MGSRQASVIVIVVMLVVVIVIVIGHLVVAIVLVGIEIVLAHGIYRSGNLRSMDFSRAPRPPWRQPRGTPGPPLLSIYSDLISSRMPRLAESRNGRPGGCGHRCRPPVERR